MTPVATASRDEAQNLSRVTEGHDTRPQPLPDASDCTTKPSSDPIVADVDRSGTASFQLPAFIQPPSREFDMDQLDFLKRCGALSPPQQSLQDQLFLSFLLYVFPFLPVLDVQDFIDAVEQRRPDRRISLILFQAVMFSWTAFVPIEALREAGFESRIAARAIFLRKVKLLYDSDWESDRIVLIQATLLHEWWYVSSADAKDPWYWHGSCLSLAITTGLNQKSTDALPDPKMRRLWRRIWWTIVSRDRLMSLITRKPMRIKDDEINLARLRFRDFDTKPYSTGKPLLVASPLVTESIGRVMLAEMFIAQMEILLIGGRIIEHTYNLQIFAASTWATYYVPKPKSDLSMQDCHQLKKEVDDWTRNLNPWCRLQCCDEEDFGQQGFGVLRINSMSLKLLRFMALETLLRPLTFSGRCPGMLNETEDESTIEARRDVTQIAADMTDLLSTLRTDNLLEYVPPLSVGCIHTTLATFLVDFRLAGKRPPDDPSHKFHDCVRSLVQLRDVWPITKGTCALVKHGTANNQIWFARTLQMLAPMARSNAAGSGQIDSYGLQTSSTWTPAQSEGRDNEFSSIIYGDKLPTWPDRAEGTPQQGSNMASTYLSSMYPVPWTAADFEVLDLEVCREIYTSYTSESFPAAQGTAQHMYGGESLALNPTIDDIADVSLQL
ncbi:hypothetical protein LTS17_003242 [Exophiala oligosperma]